MTAKTLYIIHFNYQNKTSNIKFGIITTRSRFLKANVG